MDIKQKFREEKNMDVYARDVTDGSFSNIYVKWLENQLLLKNKLKIHSGEQPTMSREEMADDYSRLKLEYTRLHEDYRRLQSKNNKQLLSHNVVGQRKKLHTKVFNLANELAKAGYGNEAVRMHHICNGM